MELDPHLTLDLHPRRHLQSTGSRVHVLRTAGENIWRGVELELNTHGGTTGYDGLLGKRLHVGVECLWNAHLHRVGCGSPGSRAHVGGMVGIKGRNVGGRREELLEVQLK